MVSHGGVPIYQTLLRDASSEEARCEHETPLGACFFGQSQLLQCIADALRGCARNERVVRVTSSFHLLADVCNERRAIVVGEGNGFACGAEEHNASDAVLCKVNGMFGLAC